MMDSEKYLRQWITDFLDRPDALLNDLPPCPYAGKAKILFLEVDDYVKEINKQLDTWNDLYDIICFVCGEIDAGKFVNDVKYLNDHWMPRGFVCLEDHKEIPESFYHMDFRNGRYNIILVQRLEKINDASKKLMAVGYYKNWNADLYNNVVAWRLGRP